MNTYAVFYNSKKRILTTVPIIKFETNGTPLVIVSSFGKLYNVYEPIVDNTYGVFEFMFPEQDMEQVMFYLRSVAENKGCLVLTTNTDYFKLVKGLRIDSLI